MVFEQQNEGWMGFHQKNGGTSAFWRAIMGRGDMANKCDVQTMWGLHLSFDLFLAAQNIWKQQVWLGFKFFIHAHVPDFLVDPSSRPFSERRL